MATNKVEIWDRGIMMSEYFSGTSGVMLPIYIDKNTTFVEAVNYLEEEINLVWDLIESTSEYHKFEGDLEKEVNIQIMEIKNNIRNRWEEKVAPDLDFTLESLEDDEEVPVLIFSLEFLED